MRGRHRTSATQNHIFIQPEEVLRARETQSHDPSQPEQAPKHQEPGDVLWSSKGHSRWELNGLPATPLGREPDTSMSGSPFCYRTKLLIPDPHVGNKKYTMGSCCKENIFLNIHDL